MIKVYPALILKGENGYSVSFHDLEGCFTQGSSLEEAIGMAQEALGLYLVSLEEKKAEIPQATDPTEIKCGTDEVISLIPCDVEKYRRNKAVKKTLTIPEWLNEAAESRHINFSSILQRALKEELQL